MYMRAWIGCIIAVVVVVLLLNDRPITIATSDTPITIAASDTEALISNRRASAEYKKERRSTNFLRDTELSGVRFASSGAAGTGGQGCPFFGYFVQKLLQPNIGE